MTSRGIGDVRRVLGEPQSWIDATFAKPEPPLPHLPGDELLRFVNHGLLDWESQVAREAQEYRHQRIDGVVMQRYAYDIRRQCSAVRRILVRYAEATAAGSTEASVLRDVVADLATGWSNLPTWRENWDEPAAPMEPRTQRGLGSYRRRG